MININLLDEASRRGAGRKRAGGTPKPSGGGGLGPVLIFVAIASMLTLNGAVGLMAWQKVANSGEQLDGLKTELKGVEDQIAQRFAESDQIRKFEEVITNQKEVLATLDPPNRLLWAEKINMLANLVPPNVFLSEIAVREQVRMVETEASRIAREKWESAELKERGEEPEVVQRPVIHYELDITGMALGRDSTEMLDNALEFQRALTSYEMSDAEGNHRRFMDGFVKNIDFGPIVAEVHEGQRVQKFVFKLRTVDVGEGATTGDAKETTKAARPSTKRLASAE